MKHTNKILLALLMAGVMIVGATACDSGEGTDSKGDNNTQTTTDVAKDDNTNATDDPSDQKEQSTESEGLEFELNDAGDAYILIGIGNCSDTDVNIPSTYESLPVTEIGKNAFKECSGLTSVIIPDSVTNIGETAFYNCSSLASITLGKGVTTIKASAFASCTSLTDIAIPDSVTVIHQGAFARCTGLVSVTISKNVSEIRNNVFGNCTSLTNVFCEAESQPSEWDGGWLSADNATVYWGGEWEYVNGVPTVK